MSQKPTPFPPVPAVGHITQMRAADPLFVGIFVEGPDDVEMWTRWLRHSPLPCGGCRGVRRAVLEVRQSGLKGCLGIIDADLGRITGTLIPDDDIVVSAANDHECDLVCSPALEALLLSLPQADSALSVLAAPHQTIREALRERALVFGLLRWVFRDNGVAFPPQLTPANDLFIDRHDWRLNRDVLLDAAARILSISRATLDAELTIRQPTNRDEWNICNGHDLVVLLRKAFVTMPSVAERCRSEKSVGWALRVALDSAHLRTFPMWQQLANWEARNPPFVVRRIATR